MTPHKRQPEGPRFKPVDPLTQAIRRTNAVIDRLRYDTRGVILCNDHIWRGEYLR